jgi:hypothetical protein
VDIHASPAPHPAVAPTPVPGSFPLSALLAGVGGVAGVVASQMTWWQHGGVLVLPGTTVTGWSLDGGKISAILGAVAFLLVLVWVLRLDHPMPPLRASGLVIGSAEAIVTALGICVLVIVLINYGDASNNSIAPGFWLALFSGVALTAGGVLGLIADRAR